MIIVHAQDGGFMSRKMATLFIEYKRLGSYSTKDWDHRVQRMGIIEYRI